MLTIAGTLFYFAGIAPPHAQTASANPYTSAATNAEADVTPQDSTVYHSVATPQLVFAAFGLFLLTLVSGRE